MKIKRLRRIIAAVAQQAWQLPQAAFAAVRRHCRSDIPSRAEAERLDRIRNPSKYLGK